MPGLQSVRQFASPLHPNTMRGVWSALSHVAVGAVGEPRAEAAAVPPGMFDVPSGIFPVDVPAFSTVGEWIRPTANTFRNWYHNREVAVEAAVAASHQAATRGAPIGTLPEGFLTPRQTTVTTLSGPEVFAQAVGLVRSTPAHGPASIKRALGLAIQSRALRAVGVAAGTALLVFAATFAVHRLQQPLESLDHLTIPQWCRLQWRMRTTHYALGDEPVAAVAHVEEDGADEAAPHEGGRRQVFIAQAAMYAKIHFGTPVRSAANDEAIRYRLSRWMLAHGHRHSHVARDVPLAMELVYLPCNGELEALRFQTSHAAERRRMQAGVARPLSA